MRSWRFSLLLAIVSFATVAPLSASSFAISAQETSALSGYWQFYPGNLLTGFDLRLSEDTPGTAAIDVIYVKVPSDWNSYEVSGRHFGSHGAGTYTTWIENLEPGELYA
ncbi:MAG TPA: hypothetical protein PKI36_12765, partial [Turneriella sp.]|nr:hypothetical protein [Turneriella sp.]